MLSVHAVCQECWKGLNHARRQIGRRCAVCETQRRRQPAGTVEQPLCFLRHLPFLEVVKELGGMFALGFPHCFENAGLCDAPEVVVDRRPPTRRDHVEADRTREPVRLGKALPDAMHRSAQAAITVALLVESVDAAATALAEALSFKSVAWTGKNTCRTEASKQAPGAVCRKVSRQSLCSSAVRATCGLSATASRSARVR
jgi:hypothetical protein